MKDRYRFEVFKNNEDLNKDPQNRGSPNQEYETMDHQTSTRIKSK